MNRDEAAISPRQRLLEEALDGLTRRNKTLPTKYLYDRRGSELFERICELPEYYPTRTEKAILREHAPAMADRIGHRALVIEPGSGSSEKTQLLLRRLEQPAGYIPVDISRDALDAAAARLEREFPDLPILPSCADFQTELAIPRPDGSWRRRVVYFPGSTIGNFEPLPAIRLLRRLGDLAGPGGGLLIGVDLNKGADVLRPAYDDADGVTAAFNLNLLRRLERELGAELDRERFSHRAVFNREQRRMEMHLVSSVAQEVVLSDTVIRMAAGETIHTENSYKYELNGFRRLLAEAGLVCRDVWTDARRWFAVLFAERPPQAAAPADEGF